MPSNPPAHLLTKQCHCLIAKVLETWDPPEFDDPAKRKLHTCVQTSFMQAMAFAMGGAFPWHRLNHLQTKAVNEGLALYWQWLKEDECPTPNAANAISDSSE